MFMTVSVGDLFPPFDITTISRLESIIAWISFPVELTTTA